MIPWFSDHLADLKKLKPLGEWAKSFDNYEHICSTCLAKLALKRCSLCSEWFNVFEDCRASLIKNLREHKQETSTFVDKKHVCPNCFAKNSFAHCSRCNMSTLLNQNCSSKYSQSTTLREWLSPCHPESRQDEDYASGVLCLSCYEQLRICANGVAERYKNWVGGTKGEYIRGYRSLKTIGRIEENRHMDDPDAVAKSLKLYAAQKGGNGYVQFFWERQQEHCSNEYVAGYGPKGNPYYKTERWTEVWYTGYATAVWAEKPVQTKTNQANDNDRASGRPKTENEYARILGLKGKITREEIRQRYRDLAKQYHPDRVADLGPELKETAERKMKEINQAYEFYQRKYGL
jgi:DnaJ-like protein